MRLEFNCLRHMICTSNSEQYQDLESLFLTPFYPCIRFSQEMAPKSCSRRIFGLVVFFWRLAFCTFTASFTITLLSLVSLLKMIIFIRICSSIEILMREVHDMVSLLQLYWACILSLSPHHKVWSLDLFDILTYKSCLPF